MIVIEMFSGIGGFRLGLERGIIKNLPAEVEKGYEKEAKQEAGIETRQSSELTDRGRNRLFSCVWANDNDKYACQIYRKRFGNEELHEGDIRAVDADGIPDHDLLCAGFPCQSFSIAGKRRGFEDTRGTLFFEICRVLRAKRPSYLLLENVKGLLSADMGAIFQTILVSLDELGYDLQWQVLNSKDFGVPQNRERVFIVGHLRGKPKPKVFPLGEANEIYSDSSSQRKTAVESRIKLGEANTLATQDGCASGGGHLPYVAQALQTDGQLRQGTSWGTDKPQSARNIRRLTPLECERLQGFPDGWTEGVSDTQRYKVLGNAVTVNVIEAIGRQLIEGLNERH